MTPRACRPPVSVIVPTRCGWPGIEAVIDALRHQVIAIGAELVIVDGTEHSDALDRRAAGIPHRLLRVCPLPASDVFELRAQGVVEATGEIIAMTEDHCVPAADYLDTMLDAHRRHTELAVAGAVINGSTDRWIDRANFLVVHARNLPPRATLPGPGWIPTSSNVSYKRDALPSQLRESGWLETVHNVELLHDGQVVFDDRIVVRHVQSTGRIGTFRNHFHAGRSMGGLARTAVGSRSAQLRWALRSAMGLPRHLVRPVWELGRREPSNRRAVYRLLPLVVAISVFDTIGFGWGVIAGPGQSTRLVQ